VPRPDALVFDLDGTLVDSLADLAASMDHALAACGLPTHGPAAYRGWIGGGLDDLVRRATGDRARAEVTAAFRARYGAHLLDATRPYPGVAALIDALAAGGVPLGVASNKPDAWTRAIVEGLFPGRFAIALGPEAVGARKPDPAMLRAAAAALGVAPAHCAYVGDTEVDVASAAAAGMTSIGVAWGLRPEELGGATHRVETPEALRILVISG
jgi:phosphoglycolate phosphatase